MIKYLMPIVAVGLTSLAVAFASCSAAFAGPVVDPFLYGKGYFDPSTGREWFQLFPDFESWASLATEFNPATGETYGCVSRNGCDIWASSSEVEQVFDNIDQVPQGTPLTSLGMGPIFAAFGTTDAEVDACPPIGDFGFATYISAGFTRDNGLIVSELIASPCGNVTGGGTSFGSAPSYGDPTFSVYQYEQFGIPEPETLALLACGLLILVGGRQLRVKVSARLSHRQGENALEGSVD